MTYYKHFDFKIGEIIDESILFKFNPNMSHWTLPIFDINPSFIKIIESKGLRLYWIEVFKLDPVHRSWPVHIDGNSFRDYPKLNFVFGNKKSPMIWYKSTVDKQREVKATAINSPYIKFEDNEVVEVDRTFISTTGTLVQVGVPHSAFLEGYSPRWILSLHFNSNFKFLTFDELAELFKEYEC